MKLLRLLLSTLGFLACLGWLAYAIVQNVAFGHACDYKGTKGLANGDRIYACLPERSR